MKILLTALFLVGSLCAFESVQSDTIIFKGQKNPNQGAPTFTQANANAMAWITLLDQRQYSSSWLDAGSLLQAVITQDQWTAAMQQTRGDLGNVTSRKLTSHTQTTSLGNTGIQGTFMTINFTTGFSSAGNYTETVTLMAQGNLNLWKVISYNISQ